MVLKLGNAELQLGTEEKIEWHSRGYLPHYDGLFLVQSITFRLEDSLPQVVLQRLEEETKGVSKKNKKITKIDRIERWLDSGYGCCALKHPQMAKVMQDALLIFDNKKYNLIAWCIMPNHVHVVIEPYIKISKIVQSWKSFTGRWALSHNAELELGVPKKKFWMREYWDRFIRSAHHLNKVIEYIHYNPVKAGLVEVESDWKWSSAYVEKS